MLGQDQHQAEQEAERDDDEPDGEHQVHRRDQQVAGGAAARHDDQRDSRAVEILVGGADAVDLLPGELPAEAALLEEGGFRGEFTGEEVDGIRAPDEDLDGSRIPLVVVPGGGSARNLLIPTMNLMFPIGFVIIALRFLLRLVLVLSKHESLEEDAAASAEATDGRATGVARTGEVA